MPIRIKLFLPVSLIITAVVIAMTVYFVNKSISLFSSQIENSLKLEVATISKMFEREASLKLAKVKSDLNVASNMFYSKEFILDSSIYSINEIVNQKNNIAYSALIFNWELNNNVLNETNIFVDSIKSMLGSTATVFQKADSGLIRISTNVLDAQGERATGTYIPNSSEVTQTVLSEKTFFGRAFVVDDWYVTAYEPIVYNEKVIGAIYVGDKEKNLKELKKILYGLTIGESGYPFVFDNSGRLIIHPYREGEHWGDTELFNIVKNKKSGFLEYDYQGREKVMAFSYFEQFDFYIAASVDFEKETGKLISETITGAVIIGLLTVLLLLAIVYYFTTEKIYKFFVELQQSKEKLDSVNKALKESEERFKKLFDSTGDAIFVTDINENIVEVNNAACEMHEFSRQELLSMKITHIKSPKFIELVTENRKIIFEKGVHSFESEHITKSGNYIQVEFTSRLVKYDNQELILSVVRNISKRIEFERQILSAAIRGEEKERQRFAREMHDGIGPLLSALKLYVNELSSAYLNEEERKMLIQQSNELIDEAVNSTRTISNNLMPTIINTYGLVKAVKTFCEKVNKTNKLNVKFETENINDRLDINLELILFRVISELINNTIKHANAKNVIILLVKYKKRIALYYKDDGVGFVVDEILHSDDKGMGLKNIISRVKSIKGNYNFSSEPGEGFNIKIEINI